jgi:hypothetical protein
MKLNGMPKMTEKKEAQQKPSEPKKDATPKKIIQVWRKKEITSSGSPSP